MLLSAHCRIKWVLWNSRRLSASSNSKPEKHCASWLRSHLIQLKGARNYVIRRYAGQNVKQKVKVLLAQFCVNDVVQVISAENFGSHFVADILFMCAHNSTVNAHTPTCPHPHTHTHYQTHIHTRPHTDTLARTRQVLLVSVSGAELPGSLAKLTTMAVLKTSPHLINISSISDWF